MADRRIRNDLDEVRTRGGYLVGYVWRDGPAADDEWLGRGRRTTKPSHEVKLDKKIKTRKAAAEELIVRLKKAGMFDAEP